MTSPADPYDHWRRSLAGEKPPIHANEPQCGYYRRTLTKGERPVAAAIWKNGDGLVCRVGQEMRDPAKEWTWLAKTPCTEVDAQHWFKTGYWPAEDAPTETAEAPSLIGDNAPPEPTDPYQKLVASIEDELQKARDWLKKIGKEIKTEIDANVAGNKVGEIRKLTASLKALKEGECDPLHKAWKDALEKYQPKLKQLDAASEHLRKLGGAYLQKLADEADKLAAQAATGDLDEVPFDAKPQIGGDTGRALRLRTTSRVVIDDAAKALKALKDEPEVLAGLQAAAARIHKEQGKLVAGAAIKTESIAA